jgi:YVTN family beta-propeller protein
MNVTSRSGLSLAVVAICLAAAASRGQEVIDSVDVEYAWVGSLAYNSWSDAVYGASEQGVFFTISCQTNNLIQHLHLHYPLRVAYDSIDNKAYCTQYNDSHLDTVRVMDGTTHNTIGRIPLAWASELVWDPVSDRLYVSCLEEDRVSVIDCRNDSVISHISVGAGPVGMDLNTRRRKLYVRNWDGESVSVVDLATNQVVATIPVGGIPVTGWYSSEMDKYYCGGVIASGLVTICGAGDTVLNCIPLPAGASAVTGDDAHRLLMVASSDSVIVVDIEKDSIVARLAVGREPSALAWSPINDVVYCANSVSDNVSIIAGNGSRVLGTINTSDCPAVLLAVPTHKAMYVGHFNSSWVYVIKDSVSAVSENPSGSLPTLGALPNPFRLLVTFESPSGEGRNSAVCIFSDDGRQVTELRPVEAPSGHLRYVWDGRSRHGRRLPAGVYFAVTAGLPAAGVRLVKLE